MQTITQSQYNALIDKIYRLLMTNPAMGVEDMADCKDAAIITVHEWIIENNIEVI